MTAVQSWSGVEIRALREAKRMSLRDFAAHLGVSERMISRWEAGRENNPFLARATIPFGYQGSISTSTRSAMRTTLGSSLQRATACPSNGLRTAPIPGEFSQPPRRIRHLE
jgi:DNA-binding XRE family transcriptional regulator